MVMQPTFHGSQIPMRAPHALRFLIIGLLITCATARAEDTEYARGTPVLIPDGRQPRGYVNANRLLQIECRGRDQVKAIRQDGQPAIDVRDDRYAADIMTAVSRVPGWITVGFREQGRVMLAINARELIAVEVIGEGRDAEVRLVFEKTTLHHKGPAAREIMDTFDQLAVQLGR